MEIKNGKLVAEFGLKFGLNKILLDLFFLEIGLATCLDKKITLPKRL